jgi:hypothetical protein
MKLESTLQRLAHSVNPSQKAKQRKNLLRKLEGAPIQTIASHASYPISHIRKGILSRIDHPKTSSSLLDSLPSLTPTFDSIANLREQILDRITIWQPAPLWQKWGKCVAVTAVLALVLRMTPALFIATPLQAESQNLLIPTKGFVSITEGARWSTLTNQIELNHPLTIRTGVDSSATIVISDDAVLRLSENTEVNLRDPAFDLSLDGPVARVIYGQVWMTSLLPEALFAGTSITLPQGTLAIKEGSVSTLADPQQSTVQVYHRFASVLPTGDNPINLIEGDQLTLLPSNETQRHLITENMREESWVIENLSKDAVHRSKVADRKQELAKTVAGILPTSTFYTLKRASEQIDLWLTVSEKSRQEKKLQHAETRINEAVVLLKSGNASAAEYPLAEYRDIIRSFASITEDEARELLSSSILSSSTTVASALPHSELYPAKKAVFEAATEIETSEIPLAEVDLYLLSDALLGIESLAASGEVGPATIALNGIEGALMSILEQQELDGIKVGKDELKAIKTIVRSIGFSLENAEEIVKPNQSNILASLKERIDKLSPSIQSTSVAIEEPDQICMTVREVIRRTNQFLASVYTYQTPRAQRNEVLKQISSLPDCPQSGRILSKVMNKVPVFTRSFVWEALQDIET